MIVTPTVDGPLAIVVIGDASDTDVSKTSEVEETPAETDDPIRAIHRQMAVLANASAPESAVEVARDALLEALGGGYELDVRVAIVEGMIETVDVAYHSLLAKHLVDIRDEAVEFGQDEIAEEASRLLKRLERSEE